MAILMADDLIQTYCEHYVPPSWNAVPTLNMWETPTPPSRLNLCITSSGRPSLKTRVQDVNLHWTSMSLTARFWYFLSSVMNEPAALFNFWTRTSDFSLCSLSHCGNGYLKFCLLLTILHFLCVRETGSQEQTIAGPLEGILWAVVAVLFFLGTGLYFWKTYKKKRNTETGRGRLHFSFILR